MSCSKMDGGILDKKSNREMFTQPIYAGSILLDAGAQHQAGAPVICTEFGGVNIAAAQNETAGEKDWGYTTAVDSGDLLHRLEKLVMAVVKGGHSCGFVYTQLWVPFAPLPFLSLGTIVAATMVLPLTLKQM